MGSTALATAIAERESVRGERQPRPPDGTTRRPRTELDLDRVNRELEGQSPQAVLAWAVETFRGRICLQSSMQRRTSVLMHLLSTGGWRDVPALFIDTGFHFAETLEARDLLASTYGLRVITVRPEQTPAEQRDHFGDDLWRWPDTYELCCHLRKERPFVAAASAFDAVISGLQRVEGGARSKVPVVGWDPRIDAYTVHPLAAWTRATTEAFIDEQAIVVHPLYDRGYPSIGCEPCTTPCQPGEGERAGRWRHIREALEVEQQGEGGPVYCKINWIDRGTDATMP